MPRATATSCCARRGRISADYVRVLLANRLLATVVGAACGLWCVQTTPSSLAGGCRGYGDAAVAEPHSPTPEAGPLRVCSGGGVGHVILYLPASVRTAGQWPLHRSARKCLPAANAIHAKVGSHVHRHGHGHGQQRGANSRSRTKLQQPRSSQVSERRAPHMAKCEQCSRLEDQ